MPARGSRMFFVEIHHLLCRFRAATVMIRAKDGHQQWWGAAMWGICANDPFLDASWLQGVPPNLHMCFSFNREIIMLKHWAYQSEVARGSINFCFVVWGCFETEVGFLSAPHLEAPQFANLLCFWMNSPLVITHGNGNSPRSWHSYGKIIYRDDVNIKWTVDFPVPCMITKR